MIELLKKRILDFREEGIPEFKRRDIEVPFVKDMVTTLVGVRKSGKTYLSYQVMEEEIHSGRISGLDQICYLHFDDEALLDFTVDRMDDIEKAILHINKDFYSKNSLFVFDEIHKVDNWESFVLRLLRKKNVRILVTGSSNELEEDKVGRQLRGKAFHIQVFPLSFGEYVLWSGVDQNISNLSTKRQVEMESLFHDYLRNGGFPGIFEINSMRQKELILQSYYQSIVASDFMESLSQIEPHTIKGFLFRLLQMNANKYFHKKMYDQMNSSGYKVSKPQVPVLYHQAEKNYLITTNSIYSQSPKKIDQNARVPYCVDWSMANMIGNPLESRLTRSLETVIYYSLIREGYQVSYLKQSDSSGAEVDFLAYRYYEKPELAIQVCYQLLEMTTQKRELASLIGLQNSENSGVRKILITLTPRKDIKVPEDIEVIHPITWLLTRQN